MEFFFAEQNKIRSEYRTRFSKLDKATVRAIKELKDLRSYTRKRFRSNVSLSFIESVLFYLTDGNPAEIKRMRKTKQKDVLDYYYLSRVQELNSLLDHIAYVKHLREEEKKRQK